jgi:pilus assembly protein CpaE
VSRYFLATTSHEFERRVRLALGGSVNGDLRMLRADSEVVSPEELANVQPSEVDPEAEVVAIGPGLPLTDALALARRFDGERPELSLIVVAHPSPSIWEQALGAGARAVVSPTASTDELREAFARASQTAARRRANLVATAPPAPAGPAGHVITVVAPKGGSGKTTATTNLGVAIAQAAPDDVVIVDADLQFGDISSALGLDPEHTIADAARALPKLDAMGLKVFLTPHESSLYTLCAPKHPAEGERIGAEHMEALLDLLAAQFRFVLVDTPAGLSEHTLSALERSTDIVVMASMDVPSIRAVRKELDALDALGMTDQRRHFVLNRSDSRVGIGSEDVEASLGARIDIAVPSSRAVPLSVNQGTPIVQGDPGSPVSKEFLALSGRFVDQPEPMRAGWFSLLKRSA